MKRLYDARAVGAQLDQILAYLDKDGVTEVMIGMGQPATLRRRGQLIKITNTPVTRGQINILVTGTGLAALIPTSDGVAPRSDVEVGGRMVRVLITRRGEDIIIRVEKSPPGAVATPVPATAASVTPARGFSIDGGPAAPRRAPTEPSPPVELTFEPTPPPQSPPLPPSAPPPPPPPPPRPPQFAPPPPSLAVAPVVPSVDSGPPVKLGTFADILSAAIARGATDLHIASGRVTSYRILGELIPIDPAGGSLPHDKAEALLLPLLDADGTAKLHHRGYVDFALASPTGGRLRANISRAAGGIKATFRIARLVPNTLEELGLPRELAKVINHHQGLVVISGPSGHGKTTSLAALVDIVNATRAHHIITVEDPIEIVYPRKAAVVSQREVGPHTKSFAAALKGSLREDPDVIVIGELRDKETVEIALTAAETGHLVLATMSTPSAAKTIDRLVDMFPPEDQQQVRSSIAGALRAIVSQRIVPTIAGGVTAAIELVTGVLPLAAMIRDDKLYQLPSLLQRGKAFGMIRMDDSLIELVRTNVITVEAAIAASDNKKELTANLKAPAGTQAIPRMEGGAPGQPPPPAAPAAPKSRFGGLFGKKDKE